MDKRVEKKENNSRGYFKEDEVIGGNVKTTTKTSQVQTVIFLDTYPQEGKIK